MAETFPILSSGSMKVQGDLLLGAIAMYPATLSHEYATKVVQFLDSSEQRWTKHTQLFRCKIEYHEMNGYDTSLIVDFFQLMKGRYVDTALLNVFDFTLDGVTYNYCNFDQDDLTIESDQKETFSFTISLIQLRPNDA